MPLDRVPPQPMVRLRALRGLLALLPATMVLVGLPALRVRGMTLAVTTLGFAVVAQEWLFRQPWFGTKNPFGATIDPLPLGVGLGTPRSQLAVYYVALAVLVLAVATGTALRHSVPGRLIVAVRDNERASAAFGVTPATVKLAVLAVSGFFAAVAGVLRATMRQGLLRRHSRDTRRRGGGGRLDRSALAGAVTALFLLLILDCHHPSSFSL